MPGCCFVQVIQDGVCCFEFRQYIARCLLEINGKVRYNQVVAIPKRDIPKELRLSEQQHLVDDDSLKKARHCKVCNLKTQVICTTCKVHLDVKCFSTYHTSYSSTWTSLLSNAKNTCFAFIFLFCDEKIDYDYYMLLQKNL